MKKTYPKAHIGLLPCAFGGSPLHDWIPGAIHYENAVKRTREAQKQGTLRVILWHQGEAESNDLDRARSYRERWTHMMTSLRKDLGAPDVPVIVGQLGLFFVKSPYARIVNEQLAMIPASVPYTAFVPSYGLKHKGDEVHFDTPSLREFGRRYAHAFLMWQR
jgi:Carbohydrate esterase, sialic acid-specific acetylesterase